LQPPDDNDRPVVRKWDVKFETPPEAAQLAINGDCASFFEKRFVAEFDIKIPKSAYRTLYPLKNGYSPPPETRSPRCLASQALKQAVSVVPERARPPKALVDNAIDSSVLRDSIRPADNMYDSVTFQVFAPSVERARELAQTIVSIYGEAFSVPLQQSYKVAIKSNREDLARSREKVAKLETELAGVNKQLDGLKEYEDIKAESLVTFTEKLRALNVDMAETKGRLTTSEKLVAESARNSSTNNQAAALKAQAVIQLAGEEAKRSEIEKILKNGALRLELVDKQGALQEEIYGERIACQEQNVADCLGARKDAEECPVPDSKVIIRPIKWQPPKDEPKAQSSSANGYPAASYPSAAPTAYGTAPYSAAAPNPR